MTTTPLPSYGIWTTDMEGKRVIGFTPEQFLSVWQARADLEAENKRLREALVWIERRCPRIFLEQSPHKIHWEAANDAGACARAALENNHD